jgi:S1-C subfamily serine protease
MENDHRNIPFPDMQPPKRRNYFAAYLLLLGVIIGMVLTNTFSPGRRDRGKVDENGTGSEPRMVAGEASNSSASGSSTAVEPVMTANTLTDYERAVIAATQRAIPAVVSIYTEGVQYVRYRDPLLDMVYGPQARNVSGLGSGVIIDPDGTIITNEHVVEAVQGAQEAHIQVVLSDGRSFDAAIDQALFNQDIAVLKIDSHDLPFLELAKSSNLVQGQTVLAIGNPFDISRRGLPTVTRGIVSATKRNVRVPGEGTTRYLRNMIQTDASINEGNSGGALIDLTGRLVGMNTVIFSSGGSGSIGIGFAISSDQVKFVLDSVKKYGKAGNISSGITVTSLTRSIVSGLKFTGDSGVVISKVEKNSPGEKDGFRAGDIIVEINGFEVVGTDQAIRIFQGAFPGEVFELRVFRDGEYRIMNLTLGEKE